MPQLSHISSFLENEYIWVLFLVKYVFEYDYWKKNFFYLICSNLAEYL